MWTELRKRIYIITEYYNREIENIKKGPIRHEDFNSLKKRSLEEMNNRLRDT